MTQHQAPQIEMFRNVYADKVFTGDDLSAVIAIGQGVADAIEVTPPLAESIPTGYNPSTEYLTLLYLNPELDIPNYYDSRATLLSATIARQEVTTIGLDGELLGYAVESVETAAGASVQALPRILSMGYEQPEHTMSAARALGAVDIESALETKARFKAFDGMLETLVHIGDYVENAKGSDIVRTYLGENVHDIPGSNEAIQSTLNTIEDPCNDRKLRSQLSFVALDAYTRSKDPALHKSMIEGLSKTLEKAYARPEFNNLPFVYSHTFEFGPVEFRKPMSQNRLIAPVTFERKPIDPRVAIKANIEVDGTYDFRTHTFAAAERGNGRSKISFGIERSNTSPKHTEQALGEVLDAQLHDIAAGQLSQETLDDYALRKQEIGSIALKSWRAMPTNLKIHRSPLRNS
jgi:hypothetical protein